MSIKRCTKCGISKPITEFGRDAQKRDELHSRCKACARIAGAKRAAAWRSENPENNRAKVAKCKAANPEKVKAAYAAKEAA